MVEQYVKYPIYDHIRGVVGGLEQKKARHQRDLMKIVGKLADIDKEIALNKRLLKYERLEGESIAEYAVRQHALFDEDNAKIRAGHDL